MLVAVTAFGCLIFTLRMDGESGLSTVALVASMLGTFDWTRLFATCLFLVSLYFTVHFILWTSLFYC
jgi:hypothetical protein